jgi:hypothetical protein
VPDLTTFGAVPADSSKARNFGEALLRQRESSAVIAWKGGGWVIINVAHDHLP